MLIGYSRVSTNEQDHDCTVLRSEGVWLRGNLPREATGGRWNRPELHRLLDHLREVDLLVVWKLDLLSRSVRDVLTIMGRIQKAKAGFHSLTEAIDTTTPASFRAARARQGRCS